MLDIAHDEATSFLYLIRNLCSWDAAKGVDDWAKSILALLGECEERDRSEEARGILQATLLAFAATRDRPYLLGQKPYASAHAAILSLWRSIASAAERAEGLYRRARSMLPQAADFDAGSGLAWHLFEEAIRPSLSGQSLDEREASEVEKCWPGLIGHLSADAQIQRECEKLRRGEYALTIPRKDGNEITRSIFRLTWLSDLQKSVFCDVDALQAELEIEYAKAAQHESAKIHQNATLSNDITANAHNSVASVAIPEVVESLNCAVVLLQRLRLAHRDTNAPMSGGGEEWHFDNPGDEHRVRAAQAEMKSLNGQLRSCFAEISDHATAQAWDVSPLSSVLDCPPKRLALLSEYIDDAEICLRGILSKVQAAPAITSPVANRDLQQPQPVQLKSSADTSMTSDSGVAAEISEYESPWQAMWKAHSEQRSREIRGQTPTGMLERAEAVNRCQRACARLAQRARERGYDPRPLEIMAIDPTNPPSKEKEMAGGILHLLQAASGAIKPVVQSLDGDESAPGIDATNAGPGWHFMRPPRNRQGRYEPADYYFNDADAKIIREWIPDFDADQAKFSDLQTVLRTEFGMPFDESLALNVQQITDCLSRRSKRARIGGSADYNEPRSESPESKKTTHNADFTMVNWFGEEYTFALGVQSSALKALWDEWEKTGLGLHQDTIRNSIDAERDSFRMDTAFRKHPAFGRMIKKIGDGKYKLAPC